MKQLSSWLLFAATSSMAVPAALVAQVFPVHQPGHCHTCALPAATCQCVRTRAVVQTQLRPEQVTTMQCVTETHVRKETYTQAVPVTKVETVTVDEGGYKMVWVPKPVTKQIAKTTYATEVKTRDVPYQVTRAVPQTVTRMVPYQTVQHVTEVVPMTAVAVPAPVIGCNTCVTGTAFVPHTHSTTFAPAIPMSATALTPIPATQTAQGPHGDSHGDWQSVPARSSSKPAAKSNPVPMPTDDPAPMVTPKTSGRFKPTTPSAAVVWSAGSRTPRSTPPQSLANNDQR
jgi:hypothetical protein